MHTKSCPKLIWITRRAEHPSTVTLGDREIYWPRVRPIGRHWRPVILIDNVINVLAEGYALVAAGAAAAHAARVADALLARWTVSHAVWLLRTVPVESLCATQNNLGIIKSCLIWTKRIFEGNNKIQTWKRRSPGRVDWLLEAGELPLLSALWLIWCVIMASIRLAAVSVDESLCWLEEDWLCCREGGGCGCGGCCCCCCIREGWKNPLLPLAMLGDSHCRSASSLLLFRWKFVAWIRIRWIFERAGVVFFRTN